MFGLIHLGDWFFVSWHRQKQPSSLICAGIFQGRFHFPMAPYGFGKVM